MRERSSSTILIIEENKCKDMKRYNNEETTTALPAGPLEVYVAGSGEDSGLLSPSFLGVAPSYVIDTRTLTRPVRLSGSSLLTGTSAELRDRRSLSITSYQPSKGAVEHVDWTTEPHFGIGLSTSGPGELDFYAPAAIVGFDDPSLTSKMYSLMEFASLRDERTGYYYRVVGIGTASTPTIVPSATCNVDVFGRWFHISPSSDFYVYLARGEDPYFSSASLKVAKFVKGEVGPVYNRRTLFWGSAHFLMSE